jgi:hypothetical protein
MNKEQIIIFSNSYSPRTGHNFGSEVLKVFTNHEVLAHNRSETKLSNLLEKYYEIYNTLAHKTDKEFFDKIVLKQIRTSIINESNSKYIMIKNTSFSGVFALPKVFPNDIHIIILRNPVDVFSSIFKSMNLNKKGYKNTIKKIGKFLGIYPYYYCRKAGNKIIRLTPNLNHFYVIKYEDLVLQKESVLEDLKQKFNTQKSIEQIKKEINNINVINTSFFEETGTKHIWEAKEKTKNFNPINRKKHSFFVQKGIEFGSKKLAKKLKYI